MKALILAGGSGTRLWPLSNTHEPKQLVRLAGDYSLLQQTILRCQAMDVHSEILILTSPIYEKQVRAQASEVSTKLPIRILSEPCQRNTAPAIALALSVLASESSVELINLFPADHYIPQGDWPRLAESLKRAAHFAQEGAIVTFGIIPTEPETEYGYIQVDSSIDITKPNPQPYFPVCRFIEKPDKDLAQQYLQSRCYLWNSGMLVFHPETIRQSLQQHVPEIGHLLTPGSGNAVFEQFHQMPNISIDYAVLEKTDKALVIPLNIGWSDMGSWESLFKSFPTLENGNVYLGANPDQWVSLDSDRSLLIAHHSNQKSIVTIGLEETVVVDSPEGLLIAKRDQASRIGAVMKTLEKQSSQEHCLAYPWGNMNIRWQKTSSSQPQNSPLVLAEITFHAHQTLFVSAPESGYSHSLSLYRGEIICLGEENRYQDGQTLVVDGTVILKTGSESVELFQFGPLDVILAMWEGVESLLEGIEEILPLLPETIAI